MTRASQNPAALKRGGASGGAVVLAIVGPTASGKSALADELAFRLGSHVISADAMQVYRHMDIGTAKTPPSQRRAPIDCIDLIEPNEPFSAALFERFAHEAIDDQVASGLCPVVCGGTGLYVRAATEDMGFPKGEQLDNPVRSRYEQRAAEIGAQAFHDELQARDPESAALIHPNNVRRVVRAFELLEDGSSYATEHATLHRRVDRHPTAYFGIHVERPILYGRIDRRVDQMIEEGLIDEVRNLIRLGLADTLTARQAIGYKELLGVIAQERSLDDALEEIKRSTRRYAKRQLTWFRADTRIIWLDGTDASPAQLADEVLDRVTAR